MRPLFRTLLFFPLRYFRRNSPCSVFLCTFCSKCFRFHCKGASLFLHLHFVDDFWVTQGRTASNNKNNSRKRRRTDWLRLQNHTDVFLFAVVVAFLGLREVRGSRFNEWKTSNNNNTNSSSSSNNSWAPQSKKNVSYRVALVWSVQKNHNEKNSYFCSTLK